MTNDMVGGRNPAPVDRCFIHVYPTIYRVSTIQGDAGFLPSNDSSSPLLPRTSKCPHSAAHCRAVKAWGPVSPPLFGSYSTCWSVLRICICGIYCMPRCKPWCWNMHTYIYTQQWPSYVGKYSVHGASGMWKLYEHDQRYLKMLDSRMYKCVWDKTMCKRTSSGFTICRCLWQVEQCLHFCQVACVKAGMRTCWRRGCE